MELTAEEVTVAVEACEWFRGKKGKACAILPDGSEVDTFEVAIRPEIAQYG